MDRLQPASADSRGTIRPHRAAQRSRSDLTETPVNGAADNLAERPRTQWGRSTARPNCVSKQRLMFSAGSAKTKADRMWEEFGDNIAAVLRQPAARRDHGCRSSRDRPPRRRSGTVVRGDTYVAAQVPPLEQPTDIARDALRSHSLDSRRRQPVSPSRLMSPNY